MTDEQGDNIRQVAEVLKGAKRVCVMTGAGVSAESGLSTFRGPDGLWEGRRPEEVATPEAFAADPDDVWRFYLFRRKNLAAAKPNPGHRALVEMERLVPKFTLVTQNVDGLHRLAGSQNVIELHGNLWVNRCTGKQRGAGRPPCPQTLATPADGFEKIPRCPECGSMMRPGVVWFGEMLPADAFADAGAAAAGSDAMIVAGTSAVVHPAAGLATYAAANGATIVEVNPADTALSGSADFCLRGPSGDILPAIVEQMKG